MKPTRALRNGDESYDVLWGMHVKIVVGVSIALTAAAATASVAAFVQQAVMETRLHAVEVQFYKHLDEIESVKAQFVRKDVFEGHNHQGTAAAQGYGIGARRRGP